MCKCDKCRYNYDNEICMNGRYIGDVFCREASKKSFNFNKVKEAVAGIIVAIIVALVAFGVVQFYYNWTKSSLEDISGKEVKPSTVIWTMVNVGGKR